MKWKLADLPWRWIRIACLGALVIVAGGTYRLWWPGLSAWIDQTLASNRAGSEENAAEGHADAHDHGAEAADSHAPVQSIVLTPQARLNLGLTDEFLKPVELRTYRRSITMPAVISPRPGRTKVVVSSPLNGIVTHVHAVSGEAIVPGTLLFEVRLTYEDLVVTQTQYLQSMSELQVENREIARLEQATRSGALSGKSLLERRYAKEKLEAHLRAQREALRMHGLSERQVDEIGNQGKLLRDLKIVAPDIDSHDEQEELRLSRAPFRPISMRSIADASRVLVVEDLQVNKGQAVAAGERLCTLSDYSRLFIEAKAFEQDAAAVNIAIRNGWPVRAIIPGSEGNTVVDNLRIAYVDSSIDPNSRSLSIFVDLPNTIVRDEKNQQGQRFVYWKYRVGQRLEVAVPVEQWTDQIVLPVDAVAKEGADWYVFQQNGPKFDRVPVHVRYRDQVSVVIANDGSIYPGDVVALRSAHRMQMAIKNSSGGGVDPHAGHNH